MYPQSSCKDCFVNVLKNGHYKPVTLHLVHSLLHGLSFENELTFDPMLLVIYDINGDTRMIEKAFDAFKFSSLFQICSSEEESMIAEQQREGAYNRRRQKYFRFLNERFGALMSKDEKAIPPAVLM